MNLLQVILGRHPVIRSESADPGFITGAGSFSNGVGVGFVYGDGFGDGSGRGSGYGYGFECGDGSGAGCGSRGPYGIPCDPYVTVPAPFWIPRWMIS